MERGFVFGVAAMGALVVASNILVQYPFGQWLTWGAFTYPFAFLVTDLVNRLYGVSQARKLVFFGFAVGILCSFIGTQLEGPFGPYVTLRIAIGSGVAFLSAQLIDVAIFDRMRARNWWQAPLASSVIGASLDTALFFFIAFSGALVWIEPGNDVAWANEMLPILGFGSVQPLWISIAIADWFVKMSLVLLALVPFRLLTGAHRRHLAL